MIVARATEVGVGTLNRRHIFICDTGVGERCAHGLDERIARADEVGDEGGTHVVLGVVEFGVELGAHGEDFLHVEVKLAVVAAVGAYFARTADDDVGGAADEYVGLGTVELLLGRCADALFGGGGRGPATGMVPRFAAGDFVLSACFLRFGNNDHTSGHTRGYGHFHSKAGGHFPILDGGVHTIVAIAGGVRCTHLPGGGGCGAGRVAQNHVNDVGSGGDEVRPGGDVAEHDAAHVGVGVTVAVDAVADGEGAGVVLRLKQAGCTDLEHVLRAA